MKKWMVGIDPAGEPAQFWVDRVRLKSGTSDAAHQPSSDPDDYVLVFPLSITDFQHPEIRDIDGIRDHEGCINTGKP